MSDLETLEAECEELLSTIRRIDLQLSERQPVGRVPDDEYRDWREWRAAALHAKAKVTTEYRAKRKALKEARHAANMPRPASGGASLDALRALLNQATPGPWELHEVGREDQTGECWSYTEIMAPSGDRVLDGCDDERDHRDAQLIAALRNAAPELLAVVEAARTAYYGHRRGGNRPTRHTIALGGALRALDALAGGEPAPEPRKAGA